MKISRENQDSLQGTITLALSKEELADKFKSELAKQTKKVTLKGFRPGKTPSSVVKRLYGRQILADMVNDLITKGINEHIESEKLEMLGRPMASKDQPMIDLNPDQLQDLEFKFDIGLAPVFEVAGISKDYAVRRYQVTPDENMVTRELEAMQQGSSRSRDLQPEEALAEKDILKINARELDGDAIKKKGWETAFTLMIDMIADADLQQEVLGKKIGDTFRFNIQTLEKNSAPDRVRKHLLNLDEGEEKEIGDWFEGTISTANRMEPAPLDQEFFDANFGEGKVTTEEEARELIRKELAVYNERRADGLLFRDIQTHLLAENNIALPDAFLKRFLDEEEHKHGMGEDEYNDFATSLRWSLIRGKLVEQFQIQVTQQEVRQYMLNKIFNQMRMYQVDPAIFERYVDDNMMKDQKQVNEAYEDILADKVFFAVKEQISFADEAIDSEGLEDQYRIAREISEAKRIAAEAIEKERAENHHHYHQHEEGHDHHHH